VERDFTSVLLANARDLHEQASIAKDNEIKRVRGHSIVYGF
jgi:hypothetical protein